MKKLITTESYLLYVDEDAEIKYADWVYDLISKTVYKATDKYTLEYSNTHYPKSWIKILYHLPLNGSPKLEGVDLLPPLEDEVEKLAWKFQQETHPSEARGNEYTCFKVGYKAAQSDKKYNEEDMLTFGNICAVELNVDNDTLLEKYNQSLSTTELPVDFIPEMDIDEINELSSGHTESLKQPIVIEGVLQGKYIYK